MMSDRRWALVVLICSLELITELVASAPMTSEQEENMPDFGDPSVAARLKCSACRGSAFEMHEALGTLRRKRKNPTEFEITEVMDSVCEKQVAEYGIQLRNNLPTHKFSKDIALYTDHEEAILENQKKPKRQFIEVICKKEAHLCSQESLLDSTLGDFDMKDNDKEL